MRIGEVWYVDFPLEENPTIFKQRPVVVLGKKEKDNRIKVLSVKVTSHAVRDEYDVTIINYTKAGLKLASVARTSKTLLLDTDNFMKKLGNLVEEDLNEIIRVYISYLKN